MKRVNEHKLEREKQNLSYKQRLPYTQRIQYVRTRLNQFKVDAFFCTNPANVFYLSGFLGLSPEEREGTLLITDTNACLYLPAMYKEYGDNLPSVKNKHVSLIIDSERDGLLHLFKKTVIQRSQVLVESENLTFHEFEMIMEKSPVEIIGSTEIIEQLRLRKDLTEKKIIEEVVTLTDNVFIDMISFLKQTDYCQLTELDLVDKLRLLGRHYNLNEFSFDPIVACGPSSSQPHYRTTNKKLTKNNVLLMDFGFKHQGYCSDLTRTIVLGEATDEVRRIYDIVLSCNKSSLQACKPGVTTGSLQEEAINNFRKHNLDQHFLHGLGHGVGIAIHEEPYFRLGRKTLLEEGMSVTVEPGLYFPNKFGIRIEDYIILESDSAIVLSKAPKELIQI